MFKSGDSKGKLSASAAVPAAGAGRTSVGRGRLREPTQVLPLLIRHEVRQLRRWFDAFDRDIVLPILLGEIALHNIGSKQNGGAPDMPCHLEGETAALRPCNAYSIASAINLPRETVRRKVERLIELGWVSKRGNGHLYITPAAHQHFAPLLYHDCLSDLIGMADAARLPEGADGDTPSR